MNVYLRHGWTLSPVDRILLSKSYFPIGNPRTHLDQIGKGLGRYAPSKKEAAVTGPYLIHWLRVPLSISGYHELSQIGGAEE